MRRTTRGQHYSAGEWGRNRVRVFPDPKTGLFQIEWRENGRRRSRSLKHSDLDRAKRQADAFAADFAWSTPPEDAEPEPLRLGPLFEMYLGEVTPTKGTYTQKHDIRAAEMFVRYWGPDRIVSTLNRKDWDSFIQARRTGQLRSAGSRSKKGVRPRAIEQNLQLLRAVLNWAVVAGNGQGVLLDRNPLLGFPLPKEKNPTRVILEDAEYQSLRDIANDVDWRFRVALVLGHETGHRIGAIRQLVWSDIDLASGTIRWRGDTDKSGRNHSTPITEDARDVLEDARRRTLGIGETPVFPSPTDPSQSVSRHLARDWWKKAEVLAGLKPKRGRGWHALRRKFASDLVDQPLKVLADLGGWKSTQTIIQCYQHPSQDRLKEALNARRRA